MRMNISVPDALAEEVRKRDLPVSAICQRALREEVSRQQAVELAGMKTLTVHVGEAHAASSFTGRWLLDPDADRADNPRRHFYYGVALTGRGRIAVFTASDDLETPNDLRDYDNLNKAARDGIPAAIVSRAAAALGEHPVVWRDI